jgi:hypothetical protein
MSKIVELSKPIRRKVRTLGGVVFVVELTPIGVVIRPPRARHGFTVPWDAVYVRGAQLAADQRRRERQRLRQARRGGRGS